MQEDDICHANDDPRNLPSSKLHKITWLPFSRWELDTGDLGDSYNSPGVVVFWERINILWQKKQKISQVGYKGWN